MMTEKSIPAHIAIIMDGNGRWAQSRKYPRFRGHLEGIKRVEEISEAAGRMGVKYLTLYTFSTENWSRPKNEVSMLMKTISKVLDQKVRKLKQVGIRFNFIGRREGVPETVLKSIDRAIEETKDSPGLTLNMAFNYGSRIEMLDAVKQIVRDVQSQKLTIDEIDAECLSSRLYTKGIPDPELMIRTSGEQRISNFLLWQLSYAEFYFTAKNWPEFTVDEFQKAVSVFQDRERRFGKTSKQVRQ